MIQIEPPWRTIEDEERDGALILRIQLVRIDAGVAPSLQRELLRRVDAGHINIVLDLSKVEFVDSSGLSTFVACLKRVAPRGSLTIVGARGAVARVLALTRLDRVFALEDDVGAAVHRMLQ